MISEQNNCQQWRNIFSGYLAQKDDTAKCFHKMEKIAQR